MSGIRVIAWGAIAVAVVVGGILVLGGSSSSGYTVRAEFKDVDGLLQGGTVKVAGVPAGKVTSLTVNPQGTAIAILTLDPGAAPIGSGASVQVRPTDLLGEHYAQLNVGNLKNPQPSGTTIPTSRTSVPVELDQVLDALNTPVRERLQILIDESGVALAGRGADFSALLSDIPPDLGQAQHMLNQVSSEDATLESLIREGDEVTTDVDAKRNEFGQLIGNGEQAFKSVALRQQQLSQTLQNAPAALTQLQSTLGTLDNTSTALIPAANELRNTTGPLTSTLKELPGLASDADPTLNTAVKVAPAIKRLGDQAQSPIKALRPTAADVTDITDHASPIISELNTRGMDDIMWFIENWSLATQDRDDLGHFVGADLEVDSSIITSALASFTNDGTAGNPTVGAVRPKSSASTVSKVASGITNTASGVSKSAGGVVSKVTSGLSNLASSVAGATSSTVSKVKSTVGSVGSTVGGVLKGLGSGNSKSKPKSGTSTTATSTTTTSSTSNLNSLLKYLLGS